ncbi:MAG: hypothetical protein PHV42_01840 [Candidatus Pacebacteria bacterium]|nr:hypothetical protein [Candidatus Paceibacterota bacterium]
MPSTILSAVTIFRLPPWFDVGAISVLTFRTDVSREFYQELARLRGLKVDPSVRRMILDVVKTGMITPEKREFVFEVTEGLDVFTFEHEILPAVKTLVQISG